MSNAEQNTQKIKKYILFSNKKEQQIYLEKDANKDSAKEESYKKIEVDLKQALRSEHLVVLSGAGSSIGTDAGKSMADLWDVIFKEDKEKKSKKVFDSDSVLKILFANSNESDVVKNKNLEELLSRLQTLKIVENHRGRNVDEIKKAISSIEEIIKDECTFPLPESFPHQSFLRKILVTRKKTEPRIKVFTLNYDKCFEEAGDKLGAIINDGFSFSQERKFSSTNFDLDIVHREQTRIHEEENFYDKVFHLYKMHGSVTWEEQKNGDILKKEEPTSPLLIYPNSSKYENSYQMPFFEMISRFQTALRTQNTTIFIIGYGFGDNHINRIIEEALRTNMNLKVFVINPSIKEKDTKAPFRANLFQFAKNNSGLILIADTFQGFTKNLPNSAFSENLSERNFKPQQNGN